MQGPMGTAWLSEALCNSNDLLDTVTMTGRINLPGERNLSLSPLSLLALMFQSTTNQGWYKGALHFPPVVGCSSQIQGILSDFDDFTICLGCTQICCAQTEGPLWDLFGRLCCPVLT